MWWIRENALDRKLGEVVRQYNVVDKREDTGQETG
jgi:hypothetical protein